MFQMLSKNAQLECEIVKQIILKYNSKCKIRRQWKKFYSSPKESGPLFRGVNISAEI